MYYLNTASHVPVKAGNDELWEKSENELREVLKEMDVEFYEAEGEAAFYGPKLDVEVKPAVGPEITLSTCQLDFLLPRRFDLSYIDNKGEKQVPVVIHRAIFGTFDRFTAFVIEETKGAFPLWLSPVEVNIIPVNTELHLDYCEKIKAELDNRNIRTKLDDRSEKLGYKIRESQTKKIPLTLIIGDNEVNTQTVSYREYGKTETENTKRYGT